MLALDLTAADGGRLGERAARVRRQRAPGRRHLQRLPGADPRRAAARRARAQRRRALRLPVGRASPPSRPAAAIWTAGLDDDVHCPIAHGEGRYVHPDPTALAADRAGRAALRRRQPQRLGRRHRRRVRRDRRRARADAAPGEPRRCPASTRATGSIRRRPRHARPAPVRSGGPPCQVTCCTTSAPLVDIDLPLPDRRDGKVRVSRTRWATDQRLFVTTDRLSAFDRIIAGVPYKGQVLNQLAAWWFERTADVVANHVVAVPDPNVLDRPVGHAAAGRGGRARLHHRRHVDVAVEAVRRRARGRSTATTSPTGCARTPPLPEPIVTPTTKPPAGSDVHDEPLTWAEVVERGLVDAAALGARHGGRPRAVPPRPAGRRRRRADPRRHEVRVRRHRRRRAAADRRGAHARLVALLGRRRPTRSGWPPARSRRASTRRSCAGRFTDAGYSGDGDAARTCRDDVVDGHVDALHRRLRTTHRAALRARRHPGRRRASPRCVAAPARGPS